MGETDESKARYGVLCGIAAYGMWGVFPLYFKAVGRVAPLEVLAHRAMWSFVMLAVLVGVLRRWGELWRELRSAKLVLMLALSTSLVAANWLIYIYAVQTGQVVQSSLGYFINPLVNVLLGLLLLGERWRPLQAVSLTLALAGVLLFAGLVGGVPWIALSLALTFAFYGLMRKIIPVDGLVSLTVETLLMAPVALAYFAYLVAKKQSASGDFGMLGLLVLSGPVTTVPLLFFGAAAHRIRLSTMGVLQYLSPTLQFLLAVTVFREPFSMAQGLSFGLIWTAIAVYAADSFHAVRQAQLALVEPFGGDP